MKKNNSNNTVKSLPMYGILLLVMIGAVYYYSVSRYEVHKLSYDKFIEEVSDGKVEEIKITPKAGSGIYVIDGSLKDYKKTEKFVAEVPYSEVVLEKILYGI